MGQIIDILFGATIDWVDLNELCREFKTQPAIYYSLKALESLFGTLPIPDNWLGDLKDTFASTRHFHDFGAVWAPLLNLDRDECLVFVEQ